MNIKGLNHNLPIDIQRAESVRDVRRNNQASADRDANGKREQSQQEHPKRHLTPQEFEEVLEKIKAMPGIADSTLTVRVVEHLDHRVIHIEDADGNIVRRLAEADLWTMFFSQGRTTGQILDKAA